ncbi:GNAT family N-acetyltransferase [Pokkaliibacter sp. CJK22405]|uniref:GNAT family N-acetyltransferase n=1 Tax=Pokkaliibacter sp. CJK22405 TaxID=3384615 RepID=UPI003984DD87
MELEVSSDPTLLDRQMIGEFLRQSPWAKGIPQSRVDTAINNSLCFGGYLGAQQVAFARVISDFATYAYLGDVFVVEAHRGKGYSKRLLEAIQHHPELLGLRRFSLHSSSARGLYASFGFLPSEKPETYMEIMNPTVYLDSA